MPASDAIDATDATDCIREALIQIDNTRDILEYAGYDSRMLGAIEIGCAEQTAVLGLSTRAFSMRTRVR